MRAYCECPYGRVGGVGGGGGLCTAQLALEPRDLGSARPAAIKNMKAKACFFPPLKQLVAKHCLFKYLLFKVTELVLMIL